MSARVLLVVVLSLAAASSAYGQCSGSDPVANQAVDELHRGRLQDDRITEAAVDGWLPEVRDHLKMHAPDLVWYRAAMIIAVELKRFGRVQEAREMLELLAATPATNGGLMRKRAVKMLKEEDRARAAAAAE